MKRAIIAIIYIIPFAALAVFGWNLKILKDDLENISRERVAVEEPKDTSFVFDTTTQAVPAETDSRGNPITKIRSFHTNGVSAIIENNDSFGPDYLYIAADGYLVAVRWNSETVWHCVKPSIYFWDEPNRLGEDPTKFEKAGIYNYSNAMALHPRSCECLFNHCSK